MVLRPPHPNIYDHPKKLVRKEPEPMTREKQVFPPPISKYMLGTINL
jgi:hypothetical protein